MQGGSQAPRGSRGLPRQVLRPVIGVKDAGGLTIRGGDDESRESSKTRDTLLNLDSSQGGGGRIGGKARLAGEKHEQSEKDLPYQYCRDVEENIGSIEKSTLYRD